MIVSVKLRINSVCINASINISLSNCFVFVCWSIFDMMTVANQSKKALNEAILEATGVPRKPMTPTKKLKPARQHKGKAAASTTGGAASAAKTIILPPPPPSPPHVAGGTSLNPPHSPPVVILDEPIRV